MLAMTDPKYVSMIYDTGHLTFSVEDPIEILQKHHDRIGHVHLKNVRKPAMDKCYAENKSFLRSIPEGVFTVPGDPEGCVDFPTVFTLLDEYNYEGWLVVEAEQDPAIANPLEYAPRSGGQFIDMSIHDFDLIRWLTGSEVKELWATGGCYEFKQYKDWDDGDNVSGLMKMENDAMAFFFAGRATAHGSHVETEIVGTRGTLRIASVPTDSLVEVMSQHGVCRECYQDFITRWHDAYITEIEEFCDCVATGRKAAPGVIDGTQSTKIAFRCKESFLTDKKLTLE